MTSEPPSVNHSKAKGVDHGLALGGVDLLRHSEVGQLDLLEDLGLRVWGVGFRI